MAEYLAAREPHDRDVLSPADAAGAVAAVLALGRERVAGRRIVKVGNPSRAVDGWESPHTVVEVVSDDAPFLVDSVSSALARQGHDVHLLFRPLLEVSGVGLTSHLHIEIDRETDLAVLEALRDTIESVVDDVFTAVADWDALRLSVSGFANALRASPPSGVGADETAEVATYLDWLADDHFTFVGAVAVDASGAAIPGSELGVARRRPLFDLDDADPAPTGLLTLTHAQARSTVHRDVPLDSVTVRRLEAGGAIGGELRLLGLYTANVFSDSVEHIPVVRRKVAEVVARSGLPPDGHDGRILEHVLATYPRDEMFRLGTDELAGLSLAIVGMGLRRRLRLFVSRDRVGCFVSCLVYLPRDRYTTPVRQAVVIALCDAFCGDAADFTVLVTEEVMARLHVVIATPRGAPAVETVPLEAKLAALARDWVDDLHDAFVDTLGEELGVDRYRAWRHAFPPAYQAEVSAPLAVRDAAVLEHLDPDGDLQLRLEPPRGEAIAHIKLYRAGGALVLSDVMPLLEHLGVTVVDEHPYEIAAPDGPPRDLLLRHRGRRRRSARRPCDPGARRRRVPGRMGGHGRERRPQPAGAARRTRGARRGDRAGAVPVPAPGRRALHRRVSRRHAARQRRSGAVARGAVPRASGSDPRPRRRARRQPPRRAARRGPRAHYRRGREPRCRPHPACALAARAGDDAHERVPGRGAPRVQVRPDRARLPAEAAPAARDLGGVAVGRRRPPARRRHRAWRHPVVGPTRGLPHRGPRADEGADGQERGHRADRREGRVLREAGRVEGRVPDVHPWTARADRQPDRRGRSGRGRKRRRGRAPAGRRAARRRRLVPGGRGRQGHGRVLRPRQLARRRVRVLARRRVRVRRLCRVRPQGDGHHVARRVALREGALPRPRRRRRHRTPHRRRHRRHVGRRVRQRAPPFPARAAGGGVRPPTRVRRPRSRSRPVVRRTSTPLRPPRFVVGRLRRRGALARWRCVPACGEVRRPLGRRPARARHRRGAAHTRRRGRARSCGLRSTSCGTAASARS